MQLSLDVQGLLELCLHHRRALHRIPEIAFEELETQAYLLHELREIGPDLLETLSPTGIRAIFYAPVEHAQTIAFRADMDALAIDEKNEIEYASLHKGCMHGCGHDGHMTVLLLLARLIKARQPMLTQNIVLLFQPAEEGKAGAHVLIEQGALKNPAVSCIYGLHVWPTVPKGKIGVRWGAMMAQTCEFDITVHGKSAHGASPQMGVDAVVAAAELISLLQTIITRNMDPHQDALLTIGKIKGGVARNVIAETVEMNGTLRVFSQDNYDLILKKVTDMARGLQTATGARFEFLTQQSYPCLSNPRPLVEDFYRFIDKADLRIVEPVLAGEDFAFYQQEIPGLFFFLGCGGGKNKYPLHNAHFDFDEYILLQGVEILSRIAFNEPYLEP